MRIVIDTNIAFSAILNTDSRIARILLHPRSKFNFYATEQLIKEIEEHREKIQKLGAYDNYEINRLIKLITDRIRFINVKLIPEVSYRTAEKLTHDIDIDDTEFIALTEHIRGKFWSGDKSLQKGLLKKGWNKFITTDELFERQLRKGRR
jgi:predicted nucleic acid-binding protein